MIVVYNQLLYTYCPITQKAKGTRQFIYYLFISNLFIVDNFR